MDRFEELGKNIVPGTPNCRLIGSRWRFLARPVEGDVVYTDCEWTGICHVVALFLLLCMPPGDAQNCYQTQTLVSVSSWISLMFPQTMAAVEMIHARTTVGATMCTPPTSAKTSW